MRHDEECPCSRPDAQGPGFREYSSGVLSLTLAWGSYILLRIQFGRNTFSHRHLSTAVIEARDDCALDNNQRGWLLGNQKVS